VPAKFAKNQYFSLEIRSSGTDIEEKVAKPMI
jgi:hypothetical protein